MFKKYLKKLKFNDDIDVNQMFEFGKQVGSGDDDDHFQCGFTSRQLLNRELNLITVEFFILTRHIK